MSNYRLIQGSAHNLPQIADASVQAICTSPPYFGLRSYEGDQSVEWPEMTYQPMSGMPHVVVPAQRAALGLEEGINSYIGHLILCLREWKRVLRGDGLCWVNLSDSYASSATGSLGNHVDKRMSKGTLDAALARPSKLGLGIKPKNLMMVPARFALAAQADGWYLRSAIVWAKGVSFLPDYAGSCMPESVTDRPTQGYEMVYMLAKSPTYYYDAEAVREENSPGSHTGGQYRDEWKFNQIKTIGATSANQAGIPIPRNGRNLRNVWIINPSPTPMAHFACWPPKLVEPMIKASTSEYGCCAACGAPWVRVVERVAVFDVGRSKDAKRYNNQDRTDNQRRLGRQYQNELSKNPPITTGWAATCTCAAAVQPCTVLDPFAGSGTTLQVAVRLGRQAIGVDLSQAYLDELVPERMDTVSLEPVKLNGHTADYDALPMFAEAFA